MRGDVFDEHQAVAARETAIAHVEEGAPEWWKDWLCKILLVVCKERPELTTDHIWERIADWEKVAGGSMCMPGLEPRVLGAIMCRGQKAGWIAPLDRWELSTRVACHRRPLRVWRSLLVSP